MRTGIPKTADIGANEQLGESVYDDAEGETGADHAGGTGGQTGLYLPGRNDEYGDGRAFYDVNCDKKIQKGYYVVVVAADEKSILKTYIVAYAEVK